METAHSLTGIDCRTDSTVSILNGCFFIYRFKKERSIIGRNFPFFLLVPEIAGNKNDKFPDLVPFPLPVSGEVPLLLLLITGRKTDSDLSELSIEGDRIEWYPETFSDDREDPFILS